MQKLSYGSKSVSCSCSAHSYSIKSSLLSRSMCRRRSTRHVVYHRATTSPVCKVDVIQQYTWTRVLLRRLYIEHLITHRNNISGNIPMGQQDTMFITAQDNTCQREQLVYMAYTRGCAVVSVRLNCPYNTEYVELRVRNSSILTGPDCGCLKKFDEYHSQGHRVYTADCQKILEPGCRTSSCYGR
ncbi:uncharacterized protein LOC142586881 isoform X2 [Dermacentor variabilis]|uniref:uncharacterized protein LOC142586881 isoform X2 n=1 Tax=Dermacentor variabilis TaxID=34621 RepID=UPI003F5C3FCF